MEIKTIEVAGFKPALKAMRNPMNSWDRSDTIFIDHKVFNMGENDASLSMKLQAAGPEHAKHLRMIQVWADISAPRYWWTEFDTYRAGVEKVSCSTMHKLTSRELDISDFELEDNNWQKEMMATTVPTLNAVIRHLCKTPDDPETKKKMWRGLIQMLPQSYIQKRTVMMSYAALRNIYRQREGHKLKEWEQFRRWVRTLPESWMITDELTMVPGEGGDQK